MPTAVIIGDSHVDDWSPFGSRLAKNLKAAGYDATKCGMVAFAALLALRRRRTA